jgi:hypothetical protein
MTFDTWVQQYDTPGVPVAFPRFSKRELAELVWKERDAEVEQLRAVVTRFQETAGELLEVAALRGDSCLPAPADDPKLWTARMQEAWDGLQDALTESERGSD